MEIIEANNRGVSAVANVSMEPNWSFVQSLFFAGTILTTIGKIVLLLLHFTLMIITIGIRKVMISFYMHLHPYNLVGYDTDPFSENKLICWYLQWATQ